MPTPSPTVADHLRDRLSAWGVRRIFGYPGDGVNGVMGALQRAGARFDFVQAAHEELAGLMAVAHAKFTGEVAACVLTSGPGAIHLLNGLYDAELDHQPVVAIVGQQAFAGVANSLLGKAAVPDDLPYVTGSVGWLGTAAGNRMMRECDTLFIVGSSNPYTEYLPEPGRARGVQIDREPRNLALRYPVDVPLQGDAAETLAALLPMLEDHGAERAACRT